MDIQPHQFRPTCGEISRACRLFEAGADLKNFNLTFKATTTLKQRTMLWRMAMSAFDATAAVVAAPQPQRKRALWDE